jgi:hypothetical protein
MFASATARMRPKTAPAWSGERAPQGFVADRPHAVPRRAAPSVAWDFSRIPVVAPRPDGAALPPEGDPGDPDVDLAQSGAEQSLSPAQATEQTPSPAPTGESPGATPLDDAGAKPSCCQMASFEKSNDSYVDKPGDTRKRIKFTFKTKAGADPKKCAMVHWIQGTAKNKDGTFRKVKMFDTIVDYNFPTMRVDYFRKDPMYWNTDAARWNYVAEGGGYYAEDSPGPTTWVDGIDYDLKLKMCLYCIDDVQTTTDAAGSGVKNPIKCIDWVFKAKYDGATDKFTH